MACRRRSCGPRQPAGAPRLLVRLWQRCARGAVLASALCGSAAAVADINDARFGQPTERYPHAVLGDALEWGSLSLTTTDGRRVTITLPTDRVFEDLRPRLADVDGDGDREAIVVESDARLGARLAVYDETGLVAATPNIGTRFRWLAPVAWHDLDGDGRVELAFVDRPHLAKTLRVWRWANGSLLEVASMPGLTNHRIGEAFISGGVADCGEGPEIILATANWRGLRAVKLVNGTLTARDLPNLPGTQAGFATALTCGNPDTYKGPFTSN